MTEYAGTVKMFNRRKNYGFIQPVFTVGTDPATGALILSHGVVDHEDDVFVHRSSLVAGSSNPPQVTLYTGELVSYSLVVDEISGKRSASNVRGLGGTKLLHEYGSYRFTKRS